VNKASWDSLPADIQAIVRKHMNAAAIAERRDIELQTTATQDKLTRQGLTFNECDRTGIKAKLSSTGYYNRWREEFGPVAWATMEKYTGRLG
jgi:TRAP-type C4-dicarboxylate transport system substrate-binding protein